MEPGTTSSSHTEGSASACCCLAYRYAGCALSQNLWLGPHPAGSCSTAGRMPRGKGGPLYDEDDMYDEEYDEYDDYGDYDDEPAQVGA